MPYRFATDRLDYSDLSGGRVLYSQPGLPAFPVRLASEIFQRALQILQPARHINLYDPTCGGAYHLSALGFLHGESIANIVASDVDESALELARRNLSLLTPAGLQAREIAIREMLEQYGKPSHAEALHSAVLLRRALEAALGDHPIHTRVFQANVMDEQSLQKELSGAEIDLVFSDVPYGQLTGWTAPENQPGSSVQSGLWRALDALRSILTEKTVVVIAADKNQKIAHESYRRLERFQVGKRQVVFLTKTR